MFATIIGDPVGWLLVNGVGQNVTAGVLVFIAGFLWSRTKYWPLHAIHSKIDRLHARHDQHDQQLDRLGRSLIDAHEKLDELTENHSKGASSCPP